MTIGVMGCNIDLPETFPSVVRDNSGNIVHANAPLFMFDDCVHTSRVKDFPQFVNRECSHLILTLANGIKIGEGEHGRYASMIRFLDHIKKPVVVFGLGAQAECEDDVEKGLPAATVDFLKALDDKAVVIGVRGPFTKQVVERHAGVTKAFVTGCPSFFSHGYLPDLLRGAKPKTGGRAAYAGTHFHRPLERAMLAKAIEGDAIFINPVSKPLHEWHEALSAGGEAQDAPPPHFINALVKERELDRERVRSYFSKNYRVFRTMPEWTSFARNHLDFTYGTRFHVNMASLLSGKAALWVTHDTRTRELVDYFRLPSLDLDAAAEMDLEEIRSTVDLEPLADNFGRVAARFGRFLRIAGLTPPPWLSERSARA